MRTLSENLSEPGTAGLDALPPSAGGGGQTQPAAAASVQTTAEVSPAAVTTVTAVTAVTGQEGAVVTKLKFSFDWTFVGVELFVSPRAEQVGLQWKCQVWGWNTNEKHHCACRFLKVILLSRHEIWDALTAGGRK